MCPLRRKSVRDHFTHVVGFMFCLFCHLVEYVLTWNKTTAVKLKMLLVSVVMKHHPLVTLRD